MGDFRPTVDPFRETDVIDANAPRANQVVVGLMALFGALLSLPVLWALMALQLAIGLTFGRQYCLPCLAYFKLIQPRIGEGPLEDSRPPRFANMIGIAMLGGASGLWWLGAETAALVPAYLTAALALLSAATGFCAGCESYKLIARLRGISPRHHDRIDPADLSDELPAALNGSGTSAYVQFTHPFCAECREWSERLAQEPEPTVAVDVRSRPELARKYGISVVPAVFAVGTDGAVLRRLAP